MTLLINFAKLSDHQYFSLPAISSHKVMSAYATKTFYGNSITPLIEGSVVHGYALEDIGTYGVIKEVQLEKLIKSGVNEDKAKAVVESAEKIGIIVRQTFADILAGCLTEVVVSIEEDGLDLKGKFDAVHLGKNYVVDVKTTSNLNTFDESIEAFNYDIQAAFYLRLASVATGREFKDFYWAIVDKRSLKTKLVRCSDDALAGGKSKIELYLSGQRMIEGMKK